METRTAVKTNLAYAAIATLVLVFVPIGVAGGGDSFAPFVQAAPGSLVETPVYVAETQNRARESAMVCLGVPLPKGLAHPEATMQLLHEERPVPLCTEVISRWPDGSTRVVLIRFTASLPANGVSEYTLRINATGVSPPMAATTNLTDKGLIARLPSRWYCASGVFGPMVAAADNFTYPQIEADILRQAERHSRLEFSRLNGFYDHAHAQYMTFLRSGSRAAYEDAQRWVRWYLDEHGSWLKTYQPGKAIPAARLRYMYIEALVEDYEIRGDLDSYNLARGLADAYLASLKANAASFRINERNPAFPLIGLMSFYSLTGEEKYLAGAREVVDIVLDWRDKERGGWIRVYEDKEECPHGCRGGSPFMTALLAEGLIHYHRVTSDPRVAEAIRGAADWLIREAWWPSLGKPDRLTFLYIQCRGDRGDQPGYGQTFDLNLMFTELLGYAWYLSGDVKYRDVALKAIRAGARSFAHHVKQYNQNMRSFGRGLYFLQSRPIATPVEGAHAGG